jgi:hypothetical protein
VAERRILAPKPGDHVSFSGGQSRHAIHASVRVAICSGARRPACGKQGTERRSTTTAVQISRGPVVAMLEQRGLGGSGARFGKQVG